MISLKPTPCSISACFMLVSMCMTGLSQAGAPDEASTQGHTDVHTLRENVAYETDRIILRYREQTAGMAAFRFLSWQVLQATGRSLTPMYATSSGAQIFKLDETKTIDELQPIIEEIKTNPDVVYAKPMMREYIHVQAGGLLDKHSHFSSEEILTRTLVGRL